MSKWQLFWQVATFWQVVGTLCKRADVTFLTTFVRALIVVRQTTSSIYQQNYNLSFRVRVWTNYSNSQLTKEKNFRIVPAVLTDQARRGIMQVLTLKYIYEYFPPFPSPPQKILTFSKYFPPFSSFSFSILPLLRIKVFSFAKYFPPVPSLLFFFSPNEKKFFS